MITVVSGTNRADSKTKIFANAYQAILEKLGQANQMFCLTELPSDFLSGTMYTERSQSWLALQKKYLNDADKLLLVFPEYNGAFPGILKLVIDASDIKPAWNGKKVSLTGVSSGRAGCLRGLDAMTNMLNYIKAEVLLNKLPISQIHTVLNEQGEVNEDTLALMEQQVQDLISF